MENPELEILHWPEDESDDLICTPPGCGSGQNRFFDLTGSSLAAMIMTIHQQCPDATLLDVHDALMVIDPKLP